MLSINKWTAHQLAAQRIIPRLDIDKYMENEEYKKSIHRLVSDWICGFCIFTGTLEQSARVITELQAMAAFPLIFCADFEYGLPMRLDGGTAFPHAMALGRAESTEHTYYAGEAIAQEARSIGVHWNLAPVCDINNNPDNPIINIRSFGENSEDVIKHSFAFYQGTQKKKVMACAKHFPGHGDIATDSHLELPVLNKSLQELESNELAPFRYATENGIQSVMTGHISVPAIDESGLPASLSPKLIGLLRNEMKYDNLIISDALDMGAITKNYGADSAVAMAIEAGNDIALMPVDPQQAIDVLAKQAENSREAYETSVRKIISKKRWTGLSERMQENYNESGIVFDSHEQIALIAANKALKISGDESLLPIGDDKVFAGFAFLQEGPYKDKHFKSAASFFKILAQAVENDCDFAFADENITADDIDDYKKGIKDADVLVMVYFYRASAYAGSVKAPDKIISATKEIAGDKPYIAVLMGNPYMEGQLGENTTILAYSDSLSSVAATVLALSGKRHIAEEQPAYNKN